jgi:DNA repair protein RadC
MNHIAIVTLRLVREKTVAYESQCLANAGAVFDLFRELAGDLDRESVWVACLDAKNRVACLSQVSVGSLDASMMHPREVMKVALLANASAIILVHNHPSGDPTPSAEDHAVTRRIGEAATILGLRFLDHLIVGHDRFYSFCDEGVLNS